MHTPQSFAVRPGSSPEIPRRGGHRAPIRWRWILSICLGLGVIAGTGAGVGLAELTGTSLEPRPAAQTGSATPTGSAGGSASTEDSDTNAGIIPQGEVETTKPSPSKEPKPSEEEPPPEETDPLVEMADEASRLANEERQNAGCSAAEPNAQLDTAAAGHAQDMAANNYFDHTSQDGRTFSDRAAEAGYDGAMSENIAMGQQTAAQAIQAWMESDGHRENLLNCDAKAIGMGVGQSADGTLYWVQMFGWN